MIVFKRRWLAVGTLVGVLALGVTAGSVFAQTATEDGSGGVKSFTARVAEKLGLTESQVQDAFTAAQRDVQDEAVQSKLDALVEDGAITQDQANEYLEWFKDRPDSLPLPGFGIGKPFSHLGGRGGLHFRHFALPDGEGGALLRLRPFLFQSPESSATSPSAGSQLQFQGGVRPTLVSHSR